MPSVPFYSQHAEDVPEEWRSRACGVTALRMALAAYGKEVSAEDLISAGVASGAYVPGIGWKHDGLVALTQAQGVEASRKEFKAAPEEGVEYIKTALAANQIPIVSVRVDGMKDTHLVPLIGLTEDGSGFRYHDSAEGGNLSMSEAEFLRRWRGLVIFIG